MTPESPLVAAQESAPQVPDKGPSTDMKYLSHAFEARSPLDTMFWDVERVRTARDEHARGCFERSAGLADAMMTDPRIFSGGLQRLGPLLGIPRAVRPGPHWNGGGLSARVRTEAEALLTPDATACPPGTLAAGFVSTAFMGVSILQNVWTPRADGSRVDVEVRPWPMQMSQWNEYRRRYQLFTTEGLIDVEPNDGKWIVVEPNGPRSFKFGAVRPLALVWADRSYAIRDRSNHSQAHGSVGIIGTLPPNVSIDDEEGRKFEEAIQFLHRARAGMVKPNGSSVDTFEPRTMAFQIFGQIVKDNNADVMLALNGLDGTSVYKSISQLDGVRYDLVRVELGAATTSYNAGFLRPWALYNFGDEDVVPRLVWLVPDPREQERIDALGRQHQAFAAAVKAYKAAGFVVDQPLVDQLAKSFGVEPPKLSAVVAVPGKPGLPGPAGDAAAVPPEPTEATEASDLKRESDAAA